MSLRLTLAATAGAVTREDARVLVIDPPVGTDLAALATSQITILQEMKPDADAWTRAGFSVVQAVPDQRFDLALICLPRAKALARHRVWQAAQVSDRIWIDGQKTQGVDSILKDLRKRGDVRGPVSKSHGKSFWMNSSPDLSDWQAAVRVIDDRWQVAPGVFSADGVDPGSALLAAALPSSLAGRIADFGAGWGYLSGAMLEKASGITELHLVEAQRSALDCARLNVSDPRASFHWADATNWRCEPGLDAVIMNPPFHTSRATDPALGRAFISAAAAVLRSRGEIWLVANRHLPYEQTLQDVFSEVREIGGDARYKLLRGMALAGKRR